MRKLVISIMAFLMLILNSLAMSQEEAKQRIYFALLVIDFDDVVQNICEHSEEYICNVLTDKRINSYLRRYWRPAMYSIAQQESRFIARIGKYDKNDVSHFQINMRYWGPLNIYKKFVILCRKFPVYMFNIISIFIWLDFKKFHSLTFKNRLKITKKITS